MASSRVTAAPAAHQQQPALLAPRPPARSQQPRETAGVQERQASQIEHKAMRAVPLDPSHLLIERVGMFEIQLTAECHAHRTTREWLDGQAEASHPPSLSVC